MGSEEKIRTTCSLSDKEKEKRPDNKSQRPDTGKSDEKRNDITGTEGRDREGDAFITTVLDHLSS